MLHGTPSLTCCVASTNSLHLLKWGPIPLMSLFAIFSYHCALQHILQIVPHKTKELEIDVLWKVMWEKGKGFP